MNLVDPSQSAFDIDFQALFSEWPFTENAQRESLPFTPNRNHSPSHATPPQMELLESQRTGSGSPQNPFGIDVFNMGESGSPSGMLSAHRLVQQDFPSPGLGTHHSDHAFEEIMGPFHPSSFHSNSSTGLFDNHRFLDLSFIQEDNPDDMAQLFKIQTNRHLTMDSDTERNPWQNLIWPMAKEYPALYDALAAMTCILASKEERHHRVKGLQHAQRSTLALSKGIAEGSISLTAALAATLALGFAETWDPERSSTGMSHIRGAEILLRQIISNNPTSPTQSEDSCRVQFLTKTWIYMDTIARFTSDAQWTTYSPDFPPPGYLPDPTSDVLDPLMGYASALFPTMRRVANLINRVRTKNAKRNSPAIISQAIEIRRQIEDWAPPIDLESCEDPTANMTDAVQLAEAYRWATLLFLYHTVPELPNLTSYGELGEKVLIYLATIPVTSQTTISQVFPLMIAGCEAVDEEDRDFVRERWRSMTRATITGIVDRCIEITEEVWRRRTEYLANGGLSPASNIALPLPTQVASSSDAETISGMDILGLYSALSSGERLSPTTQADLSTLSSYQKGKKLYRLSASDFPLSAAFKKGVDMITRSGASEYTVKGNLHFLGVMKEWNLQVMLG